MPSATDVQPRMFGSTRYIVREIQGRICLAPESHADNLEMTYLVKSDPRSGRDFYVNVTNKAKSWDLPDVDAQTAAANAAMGSAAAEEEETKQQQQQQQEEESSAAAKVETTSNRASTPATTSPTTKSPAPVSTPTQRGTPTPAAEAVQETSAAGVEPGVQEQTESGTAEPAAPSIPSPPPTCSVDETNYVLKSQAGDSEEVQYYEPQGLPVPVKPIHCWVAQYEEAKQQFAYVNMENGERVSRLPHIIHIFEGVEAMFQQFAIPEFHGSFTEALEEWTGKEAQLLSYLLIQYGFPSPTAREVREIAQAYFVANDPSRLSTLNDLVSGYGDEYSELLDKLRNDYGPQPLTFRDRVRAMYAQYSPSKLKFADEQVSQYAANPEDLLGALTKRFGQEPVEMDVSSDDTRLRATAMFLKYDESQVSTVKHVVAIHSGSESRLLITLLCFLGPELKEGDEAESLLSKAKEYINEQDQSDAKQESEANAAEAENAAEVTDVTHEEEKNQNDVADGEEHGEEHHDEDDENYRPGDSVSVSDESDVEKEESNGLVKDRHPSTYSEQSKKRSKSAKGDEDKSDAVSQKSTTKPKSVKSDGAGARSPEGVRTPLPSAADGYVTPEKARTSTSRSPAEPASDASPQATRPVSNGTPGDANANVSGVMTIAQPQMQVQLQLGQLNPPQWIIDMADSQRLVTRTQLREEEMRLIDAEFKRQQLRLAEEEERHSREFQSNRKLLKLESEKRWNEEAERALEIAHAAAAHVAESVAKFQRLREEEVDAIRAREHENHLERERTQLQAVEAVLPEITAANEALRAQLGNMESKLHAAFETVESVTKRVDVLQDENTQLVHKYNDVRRQCDLELRGMRIHLDDMRLRAANVKSEFSLEMMRLKGQHEVTVLQLTKQLEEEKRRGKEEARDFQTRIDELSKELATAKAFGTSQEADATVLRTKVSKLESEVQTLTYDVRRAYAKINNQPNTCDREVQCSLQPEGAANGLLNSPSSQDGGAQSPPPRSDALVSASLEELEAVKNAYYASQRAIEELLKYKETAKEERTRARHVIHAQKKKIDKLEAALEKMQLRQLATPDVPENPPPTEEENIVLREQLSGTKRRLIESETECSLLKREISDLRSLLALYMSKASSRGVSVN